ncbi:MAG: glycoside hydrolase [Muribaculaceae bacterium]|nr:glycoside hydrolase [Muribaculaceae bacterium]
MKYLPITKIFVAIVSFLSIIGVNAQDAKWIIANDTLCNKTNTWVEFEKNFDLKKKPKEAFVKIAADSKYWLWVNDSSAVFEGSLKRGPNPKDGYYDIVNIAPYLKKGNNSLMILLCYFGKPGFSHNDSGKAGLIFDGKTIGLVSDSTWLSRRLPEYGTAGLPITNYRLSESNIRYDARLEGSSTFKPSVEIGKWGDQPWNNLVERPIPQWKNHGIIYVNPEIKTDEKGNKILSVRLPYNMQMTPVIELSDPLGGTEIKLETDHVRGGSAECVRAEYVTKPGNQKYESLGWMNGDVLNIIYPENSAATISKVGYRETGYDTDFEGSFVSNDTTINRFWDKAMRTLYVNMRDNYFDCPDRERAQWWGDVTILMGQSFYQLSPKANALIKKAIHELVNWQKTDGTLYAPIPASNWNRELPAQSLAAIGPYGFTYYYLHTADSITMRHVYEPVKRYLNLWELDSDGLTAERKGGWAWGDWGTNADMRLILAAWHYLALKSAIQLAELNDLKEDIPVYQARMDSIATAFNKCWNGYAYRHPSYQGATDDRVQAMAVLTGIADSTKYDKIFKLFESQEYASPYMEKYVLEALMKMGHGDYAVKRFKKRFNDMIADTTHSTLFEGWQEGGYGGGSTNHAWSGGMLTVIAENICGLRPLTPGWKTFMVNPNPILSECNIEVPSVAGLIKESFKDTDKEFTLTLTVPDGTKAIVILPESNYAEVKLNGKTINIDELQPLGKGTYTFKCVKSL